MDIKDRIIIQKGLEDGKPLSAIARGDRRRRLDGVPGGEGEPHHGQSGKEDLEPLLQETGVHGQERVRRMRAGKMRYVPTGSMLGGVRPVRGEPLRHHRAGASRMRGLP